MGKSLIEQAMDNIKWSETKEPNEDCRYHHVCCDTPLGEMRIEWKNWKDDPLYDLVLLESSEYFKTETSLDDAKYTAAEFLVDKVVDLRAFLFISSEG